MKFKELCEALKVTGELLTEKLQSKILQKIMKLDSVSSNLGRWRTKESLLQHLRKFQGGSYNLTSVTWDQVEDSDFEIYKNPSDARKKAGKNQLLFWVSESNRLNPYAEWDNNIEKNTLIGISIGTSVFGRDIGSTELGKAGSYSGGLNNTKRFSEVSDVVYGIDLDKFANKLSSKDKKIERSQAKSGAEALKSNAEVRKENRLRYEEYAKSKYADEDEKKIAKSIVEEVTKAYSKVFGDLMDDPTKKYLKTGIAFEAGGFKRREADEILSTLLSLPKEIIRTVTDIAEKRKYIEEYDALVKAGAEDNSSKDYYYKNYKTALNGLKRDLVTKQKAVLKGIKELAGAQFVTRDEVYG